MNIKIAALGLSLLFILLSSSFLIQNSQAQAPPGILPVVAIHVSENTQAHWSYSTWTYFSINRMLEEAFESDGTPYVEVTDQEIENGGLLVSGSPKYPILFSLACECISDTAAAQIASYANAGGFVYVGSSSWTRYADGSYRSDFALSAQMGVRCVSSPSSNNWAQVQTATRTASNRLVNSVPANVAIDWRLPLTDHTLPSLERNQNSPHFAWAARTTTGNPAQVLMTINSNIMLSVRNASRGLYIYHSELAALASFDIYSPVAYEYTFFKEAVQWAFENSQVPLVRLSPWPYQYNSAFIVRHDMDISYERVPWIAQSAQAESNLGVTGQYYIVTGDVRDASNSAQLIGLISQAQSLGAQIGSHNGGLNCAPWNPSLNYGSYEYYHWGPDYAMSVHPSGQSAGMAYANNSIKLSFDDLQGWLGQRPIIWVSPAGQSCWDESYQILESLGAKCSGEDTSAPYPQFAYSIITPDKSYDILKVPFSRWITSSGLVCQSMEEVEYYAPNDITEIVDFYYNQGVLVSPYSHSSSSSGIYNNYITYALSKPYMWSTTPSELRDWALVRKEIQRSQVFTSTADGQNSVTVTLSGSTSANNAVDVKLPFDVSAVSNLQVLINGVPSTSYRNVGGNVLKIQAGTAQTVTVSYSTSPSQQQQSWIQTGQSDFQAGAITNLDAASTPGQLTLAQQTSGGQATTLFYDDFTNATFTTNHWTTKAGTYTVTNGYYHMTGEANAICSAYTTASSWTNYAVETRVRYVSGQYTGELGARLNPTVGSRYDLLLYPNEGGPNRILLAKFSSWQDLAGTTLEQATVATDTNWHTLRLELNGNTIKGYYDNQLLFDVVDGSYSSGVVSLESYGNSVADYDWVNVTSITSAATYYTSGSLVSAPYDCSQTASWGTISWTGSTPSGTSLQVRTRTASTQEGLSSASWSGVYPSSGATISSPSNRWIQYRIELSTTNDQTTPSLYDITITYSAGSTPPPSSSWTQTSQSDFQAGTLTQLDATATSGQLTLAQQSSQTTILFSDDFTNASWTSSHWITYSGSWTVSGGYYNMAGQADQLLETSAGDQTWSNYNVEARVRYISGEYAGELGARLNPTTGARYSLLLYPNQGGPNVALLVKFTSWQDLSGTILGENTVTTDTNWHTLRMELNGANIKGYYDGSQIFNVNDNSYTTGKVSFESYGVSNAAYDWVNVTAASSASYASSGTLTSSAYDAGSTVTWQTISWSASVPSGTNVQFRTRTAATQAGLASAAWSGYYTVSGATIISQANRWIQYEATLSTSNAQATSTLQDVTITYSSGT